MGLKNDIKFKILQELMQETNIERPISIWKLRDAVYGEISVEGDKEKKKNKRDNQIRTVKKDVFELEAEGIVTITEMDEDGKIDNKKNIICYKHPLSQKKLPFLIEHTFTMTATMEEKQEIIRDLIMEISIPALLKMSTTVSPSISSNPSARKIPTLLILSSVPVSAYPVISC